MARRLALHYVPRSSFVHALDARTKLFAVLLLSSALLRPNRLALAVVTLGLVVATAAARLPWALLWRTYRGWLPFFLLVFLVQAFSLNHVPSKSAMYEIFKSFNPLGAWRAVSSLFPHREVFRALDTVWRLGLMVSWAVVFTAVTPPRDLQHAVLWLLRPLPFFSSRRIAVMVALSLRFFAQLLDDAEHIRLAERARSGDRPFRPFRRLRTTLSALFRKALAHSETTALAMAARGYREDVAVDIPPWPTRHGAALGLWAIGLAALQLF
ncbi:energy-coupling factor transporter transmembrane component T family protein [Desulfosoma caldarium]|uniref:Biotin transport system permease protein/energy-coupling factor transport system permease protein n=1 Tax=Desulfosoma caldarium TaxID=610254 RepID=A0A3N1VIK0_9BACT|nr:energy-coupling factor transporter transmembrane component T [Desulfosoma caldarium]ROR01859.1 biotin transport system permease protein/energy-coupling factor transport system permease protein [Desulfosoma caldarium]